jgi:hypothetical protein
LKEIKEKLSKSRSSVLRYLNQIGYISSYNSSGEYYTLDSIPKFDSNGIWKHNNAYFSVHGSLKDTVIALVNDSEIGYTHEELFDILGITMFNTLLEMVNGNNLVRQNIDGTFVYLSPDRCKEQIAQRFEAQKIMQKPKVVKKRAPRPTPDAGLNETIEVLLAFIDGHCEARPLYSYLYRKGVKITPKQVQSIFDCYDLGKKNCSWRNTLD